MTLVRTPDGKIVREQNRRRQGRAFGVPEAPSGNNSTPLVESRFRPPGLDVVPAVKAMYQTTSFTREPQDSEDPHVLRVRHPATNEVRDVDRGEARRLMGQGWIPEGVVNAPPAPVKPVGKL